MKFLVLILLLARGFCSYLIPGACHRFFFRFSFIELEKSSHFGLKFNISAKFGKLTTNSNAVKPQSVLGEIKIYEHTRLRTS